MPPPDNTTAYAFLDTPSAVEEFVHTLSDSPFVALDTEGASFHRYVDRVYLIQLAGPTGGAIVDPLAMETPPALGALLNDPDVEVVLHDADYDLRLLKQDYGWNVRRLFDTRVAAQLLGIRSFGLGALLERYFGVTLDKKFQRADWSMRPLSAAMLDYAALDTSYLIQLRDVLGTELGRLDRVAWAEEEFRRIEGARWEADDEEPAAFLRIKGARELSRPQLAVLREMVAWRDNVARDLDRAAFRVMGNESLLEIARSEAASREEILSVRGVPRSLVARRGDELLAAIARGRATPADRLPRFPKGKRFERDPRFDERVARLRTARDAAAQKLELDPGVLCSRERLEAIARRAPATFEELLEVGELRRWQAEILGSQILRAVS